MGECGLLGNRTAPTRQVTGLRTACEIHGVGLKILTLIYYRVTGDSAPGTSVRRNSLNGIASVRRSIAAKHDRVLISINRAARCTLNRTPPRISQSAKNLWEPGLPAKNDDA